MTRRRWRLAIWTALFLVIAGAIGWRLRGDLEETAGKAATPGSPPTAERASADRGEPSTAPGSIEGSVRDPDGRPIAGATVCTESDELDDRDPVCTSSGAGGQYRLTGLPPASYRVGASAPTYLPAAYTDADEDDELALASGEARRGVDLILHPGGVVVTGFVKDIGGGTIAAAWITGESRSGDTVVPTRSRDDGSFQIWVTPGRLELTAWADGYTRGETSTRAPREAVEILLTPESVLAGRVVEAGSGAPVPGAKVIVGDDDMSWSLEAGTSASARTDGEGRFRLTGLAPGRYKPSATSPSGYGQAPWSVALGLGQTVDDVVIPLHPAVTVRGRVTVAKTDAPCKNGFVWLSGARAKGLRTAAIVEGRALFEGVLPGTYDVEVHCAGFLMDDEPPLVVAAGGARVEPVWRVRAAGARIRGTVRRADGKPAAAAQVAVRQERENGGFQTSITDTSPDGTFLLEGLGAGEYRLSASTADQPGPAEPVVVAVPDGGEVVVDLQLMAGGSVAGDVVDERGQPQAGVAVQATPLQVQAEPLSNLPGDSDAATTDREGRFALSGLRPGRYRVVAEADALGAPLRAPGGTDDDPVGVKVTIEAGATAHAHLVVESRSGVIRGRVVDARGAPVTDAFVDAERESDSRSADDDEATTNLRWSWDRKPVLTDTEGRFAIEKLAPGTYTVVAQRRGGGEVMAHGVAPGRPVTLTIRTTGSIAGVIERPGGPLPERFTIDLGERATSLSRTESFFRTAGAFALRDLPAGTYTLSLHATEGTGLAEVTLADGQDLTGVSVTLKPAATLTGRVVSLDDGTPVAGMTVFIASTETAGSASVPTQTTDKTGRFTVENAPAGPARINVMPIDVDPAWAPITRRVTIEAGRTTDIGDLSIPRSRLRPGAKIGDLGYDLKTSDLDPDPEGLRVGLVRPGGPAARAGLQVGDRITTVDGKELHGDSLLHDALTRVPSGTTVTLGLERGAALRITAAEPP